MEDMARTKSLSEREHLSDRFRHDIGLSPAFRLELESWLSLGFEPDCFQTEIHTIDCPGSLVCQMQSWDFSASIIR